MKGLKFNGNVDRWFVDVQEQFGKKFVIVSSKQWVNVLPAETNIGALLKKDLRERLVCACSSKDFEEMIGFRPKQLVSDVIRNVTPEMQKYPQRTLLGRSLGAYVFSKCTNFANPSADPLHTSNFLTLSAKFVDYSLLVERAWSFSELYRDEVVQKKEEDDRRYDQISESRKAPAAQPVHRTRSEFSFRNVRETQPASSPRST